MIFFHVVQTQTTTAYCRILPTLEPHDFFSCSSDTYPPADVSLGGGFEIDFSAAAIMKRFEQISDENLNKKIN